MKQAAISTLLLYSCVFFAWAQLPYSVNDSLYRMAQQQNISQHFSLLYYQSTCAADAYTKQQATPAIKFLTRFKEKFAAYFFSAANNYLQQKQQTFCWQHYYSSPGFTPFQYYFLGMNAHINGDMWEAIINSAPYDSIKKYKVVLTGFQRQLNSLFDSVYHVVKNNHTLQRFHILSFGADRVYGKKMMRHWRKNQIKLALLYYSHPDKFNRRLAKTRRKMVRMDAFVIKHFT
jgi:hypothetical protein